MPRSSDLDWVFALYLSHDRIDIQFAVKILSSYMSRPTKNAYCGLRKLACYLKSTADFEIEFSGSYEYQSVDFRQVGAT